MWFAVTTRGTYPSVLISSMRFFSAWTSSPGTQMWFLSTFCRCQAFAMWLEMTSWSVCHRNHLKRKDPAAPRNQSRDSLRNVTHFTSQTWIQRHLAAWICVSPSLGSPTAQPPLLPLLSPSAGTKALSKMSSPFRWHQHPNPPFQINEKEPLFHQVLLVPQQPKARI
jgi:hypothetical protein